MMCWSDVRPAPPASNVVAALVVLSPRVSSQAPIPVHGPDHPAKVVPGSGAGVKTTAVPLGKVAVHFPGQSIPAGVLIILPCVVPMLSTVSEAAAVKVAVTDVAAFKEMLQLGLMPLQPPDHPTNLEPGLAAAFSVTDVPSLNVPVHVLPQLTLAGLMATVPAPSPAVFIVSWKEVAALAVLAIPHKPTNNTRQEKLPRQDLDVDITPPEEAPYVLVKSSGFTVGGEG